MSSSVRAGRAFVELYAEKSQLYRGLEESEERLRRWVQNIGLATTAVGAGILGTLVPAVKAASDQAESLNAFGEVFRGANAEADRLAKTIAGKVGRSSVGIAAAMTPIGAMVKGMGLAADESARFSAAATQAALDISSFFNASSEDAFARVRSALSGSSEAVDQFGINLRKEALELKLAELGYEGNVQAASELEKTLARLAIIQESLVRSGAAGDLERTKDQYANLTRTLSDSFDRLMGAAGNAVKPIAESLVRGLNAATQAAASWLETAPELIQGIAGLGAAAVVGGTGLLALSSQVVMFAAHATLAAVGTMKLIGLLREWGIAAKAAAIAQSALNLATLGFSKGAGAVLPYLTKLPILSTALKIALVALGVPLGTLIVAFGAVIAGGAAVGVALYAIHKRTGALQPLFDAVARAGSRIAAVWQLKVVPAFASLSQLLGGSFGGLLESLAPLVEKLAELFGDVLVAAVEVAVGALAQIADGLKWVTDSINKLLGIKAAPGSKASPAGGQAATGGAGSAAAGKTGPSDDLKRFADQVKEEVRSPGEVFADIMKQLDAALAAELVTAEEYRRKKEQAEQERDAALKQEFDNSPAGQLQQELSQFSEGLIEATRTPQEIFQQQMDKIAAAYAAGLLLAEDAERGMEQARQALQQEIQKVEEDARRAAEEQRKTQLDGINRLAEQRIDAARALGGDQGRQREIEALRRQSNDLRQGGFKAEGFDTTIAYLGALVDRAAELDQQVGRQRDEATFTTASAREAIFGLGTKTVDEQLLEEQKAANEKAENAKILLSQISAALDKLNATMED